MVPTGFGGPDVGRGRAWPARGPSALRHGGALVGEPCADPVGAAIVDGDEQCEPVLPGERSQEPRNGTTLRTTGATTTPWRSIVENRSNDPAMTSHPIHSNGRMMMPASTRATVSMRSAWSGEVLEHGQQRIPAGDVEQEALQGDQPGADESPTSNIAAGCRPYPGRNGYRTRTTCHSPVALLQASRSSSGTTGSSSGARSARPRAEA